MQLITLRFKGMSLDSRDDPAAAIMEFAAIIICIHIFLFPTLD